MKEISNDYYLLMRPILVSLVPLKRSDVYPGDWVLHKSIGGSGTGLPYQINVQCLICNQNVSIIKHGVAAYSVIQETIRHGIFHLKERKLLAFL